MVNAGQAPPLSVLRNLAIVVDDPVPRCARPAPSPSPPSRPGEADVIIGRTARAPSSPRICEQQSAKKKWRRRRPHHRAAAAAAPPGRLNQIERVSLLAPPSDLEQFSRPTLAAHFQKIVVDYIERTFGAGCRHRKNCGGVGPIGPGIH
jgi:hypothetical protein